MNSSPQQNRPGASSGNPDPDACLDDPYLHSQYRLARIDDHPIMNDEVVFGGAAIDGLYRAVRMAVMIRAMGLWCAAETGAGKTFGARAVVQRLAEEFPRVASVTVNTRNLQSPSIRHFYQGLLTRTDCRLLSGETGQLIDRLLARLQEMVPSSGMRVVVLFVDEAHSLRHDELLFLRDLDNDLVNQRIRLIPILIGETPDLEALISRVQNGRPRGLAARFARRQIAFPRLNSVERLQELLSQFDVLSYPSEAWPFSRYFVPRAFDAGFRLGNEATNLASAIEHCSGLPLANGVPNRELLVAVRCMLRSLAQSDSDTLKLDSTIWTEACEDASIAEAMHGCVQSAARTVAGAPE